MRNNEELRNEIANMYKPNEEGIYPSLLCAIKLLLEICDHLLDKKIKNKID